MTVDEVIEQLKRTTLVSVNGIVIAVVLHALESLRDENARLSQAAEPEAVEPKDWPDAQGLWSRQGKIYAALTDRCEMMVRNINGPQWRNVCDSLRGNWLPCKVLVPSAKEPEAKPERPPMLLALNEDAGDWMWHSRRGDHWAIAGSEWQYNSHGIYRVDESASDPEAVAIWKRERAE